MPFNPNKTTRIAQWKVDKALFWFEVKLWTKVIGITGAVMALALWMLFYLLERI